MDRTQSSGQRALLRKLDVSATGIFVASKKKNQGWYEYYTLQLI